MLGVYGQRWLTSNYHLDDRAFPDGLLKFDYAELENLSMYGWVPSQLFAKHAATLATPRAYIGLLYIIVSHFVRLENRSH